MNQTLGQYLASLREAAVPFPLLSREQVEAMVDTEILCELVRRRWGTPRKARKVARHNRDEWNTYFLKQQQERRGLSMDKVAERADVDTVTVFKIEKDRGVTAGMLRQVMERGLGLAPDGSEIRRALALLTARSAGGKIAAADLQKEIASVEHSQSFNRFLERAVPVLATISPKDYDAVLEALGNPALVETLAALNDLATKTGVPKLRVVQRRKG